MVKPSVFFITAAALFGVTTQASADTLKLEHQTNNVPSDSPSLAALGPYIVGFKRTDVHGVSDLVSMSNVRKLPLAIWYPAQTQSRRQSVRACYQIPTPSAGGSIPSGLPAKIGDCGNAINDAAPYAGSQFPVVLLSHGLNGWATGWSQLGENLASKGYVVIAIDHNDRDPIEDGGINRSFGESVLRRTVDQRAILQALQQSPQPRANALPSWLSAISNGDQVALIGYSMGGYGALASAGAGLSPTSGLTAIMPAAGIAPLISGHPSFERERPSNLRALVLIAPFGGAMPLRAWSPETLSTVKLPTLIVSGDEDDIVDYRGGVRWLFENLSGADRQLLTYQNARHNVAMDPTPSQVRHLFVYRERFDEPVWRSERIQAINAHAFTAFLGETLKGDRSLGLFLSVPTARALDGQWPLAPNQNVGASTATSESQPDYWPGFQRRWAVGLTLETKSAQRH